jgi:hypothetical protein
MEIATIQPPTPGMAELKAAGIASGPDAPVFHTPVSKIDSALIVDVTKVMMNTSIMAARPCWSGRWLFAVPYVTAAVP